VSEITFTVHRAEEGGYWAEAEEFGIYTQALTLDDLAVRMEEAVRCHFDEDELHPSGICLRLAIPPLAA
jgi:predicted RNase H-like HicB family nuclease